MHGPSRRVAITRLNGIDTARSPMHVSYSQRSQLMAAGARSLIHDKQRTVITVAPDFIQLLIRGRHHRARQIRTADGRGDIQFVVKTHREERDVCGKHTKKPGRVPWLSVVVTLDIAMLRARAACAAKFRDRHFGRSIAEVDHKARNFNQIR